MRMSKEEYSTPAADIILFEAEIVRCSYFDDTVTGDPED